VVDRDEFLGTVVNQANEGVRDRETYRRLRSPHPIGESVRPLDEAPRKADLEDDLALQEIVEMPVR
jgi:hypothetical protein